MSEPLREILRLRTLHHPALPAPITCTIPFALPHGPPCVAIGCAEGVWVVDTRAPQTLHRALTLRRVSELAVVEEYGLLLVLADKALYCCSLDALDASSIGAHVPQLLSGAVPIDFFRVGIWSHSLVVVCKRRGMTDSVFHVLEPMLDPPPPPDCTPSVPPEPAPVVAHLAHGRTCSFRSLKVFYVPADCTDLVFLRSTVAVLHPRGVEILDIDTLCTATVPATLSKQLAQRCRASRPLALFRAKDGKHFICYTTFGLFVDRHGEPGNTIEWHGTVSAVAPVAPYIVLFKARSIEVRHATTGRLEQVIFAADVRCSWRGPGMLHGELDEDDLVPEAATHRSRMQVVMDVPHAHHAGEIVQHVHDLVLNAPPSAP